MNKSVKNKIDSGNQFDAYLYEGYLKICCGGGTGYAINCDAKEKAMELLEPIKHIAEPYERNIINHCQKSGWKPWDYYDDKILGHTPKI